MKLTEQIKNSVLWMASNGVSEVKIAQTLGIARSTVHDIKVGGRDRTEKPPTPPSPWVGRCFEDVPGLTGLRISAMPLPAETPVWRSREIGE